MNTKTLRMVCGIILWAAAALLTAFAIWAFIRSTAIISQAKAAGQLSGSGSGYLALSFYMDNSLVYLIYALILAPLGLLLLKKDWIKAAHIERDDARADRGEDGAIEVHNLHHRIKPETPKGEESIGHEDSEDRERFGVARRLNGSEESEQE